MKVGFISKKVRLEIVVGDGEVGRRPAAWRLGRHLAAYVPGLYRELEAFPPTTSPSPATFIFAPPKV